MSLSRMKKLTILLPVFCSLLSIGMVCHQTMRLNSYKGQYTATKKEFDDLAKTFKFKTSEAQDKFDGKDCDDPKHDHEHEHH